MLMKPTSLAVLFCITLFSQGLSTSEKSSPRVRRKSADKASHAEATPLSKNPDVSAGCPVLATAVDFQERDALDRISFQIIYKNQSDKGIWGVEFFIELLDGVAVPVEPSV